MSDYKKLKNIYDQIDPLIDAKVDFFTRAFKDWNIKAEQFILEKYGEGTKYKKFKDIKFSPIYPALSEHSELVEACKEGLLDAKTLLGTYLENLKEELRNKEKMELAEKKDPSKVFIIHGHDGELKLETARLLEHQTIEAVILSEQIAGGRTIIEQLEKYTNVPAAVCLFTADDLGKGKDEKKTKFQKRARQNVVFETGLLMGKIGRKKLIIIAENGIEMPSDLKGVIYIDIGKNDWKISFLKGLEDIGFKVDLNRL